MIKLIERGKVAPDMAGVASFITLLVAIIAPLVFHRLILKTPLQALYVRPPGQSCDWRVPDHRKRPHDRHPVHTQREARLSEMLEAMLGVRIPPGTSIHIVDNGSTDGTHELLESYKDRLPLVLYTQPIPGKNHCLNLVLSQVLETMDENELVVLTDDDILPGPDWLEEMESAGRAHGDCNVFAGRILPHWPYSDISHLDALRGHFGILFSLTNSKEGPCPPVLAWGPNMAVRAGVFQSGTRFDPAFGPNGGISFPMGSEPN